MNRTRAGAGMGLLIAALSAGCSSSPSFRFYRLNEIAPNSQFVDEYHGTGALPPPVRLDPVSLPAELDRPQLVVHEGDNRVRIAHDDRWIAPLDEQVRRVLSDDLVARLSSSRIADPNEPATSDPRRVLSVAIARFDANETCAVTLHASWTLHGGQGNVSGSERIEIPAVAACPAGLPAGMSQALGALADKLASVIMGTP
jgi:uncharacterized lipoprotein YmbA